MMRAQLWRRAGTAAAVAVFVALPALARAPQDAAPPAQPPVPAAQPDQGAPAQTPPAQTAPAQTPPVDPSQPPDPMSGFYGNTLIGVDGGIVSKFYYKPDHTFDAKVPAFFMQFHGTWYVAPNGDVCRVFDVPPPTMSNPDCGPMHVHQPGDTAKDEHGDTQKLVPGVL